MYSFNNFCLKTFSKAGYFIFFISQSVYPLRFNIDSSVNDSIEVGDLSCLTSSNKSCKVAVHFLLFAYLLKVFSVIEFPSVFV